jgi:hypothetical protein
MNKILFAAIVAALGIGAQPASASMIIGNYGTGGTAGSITIPNASGAILNPHAAPFQMGATSADGQLILRLLLNYGEGSSPTAAIYSDMYDASAGYNRPSGALITLTKQPGQTPGGADQDVYFTGAGTLAANTRYWVVVGNAAPTAFLWDTLKQTSGPVTTSDLGAVNPGLQDYKFNIGTGKWLPHNGSNTDERGVYELDFVPEPQAWAMAGVVLCAVGGFVVRRRWAGA